MGNSSVKDQAKKRDIIELIRLVTWRSHQLEPNISTFVQQAVAAYGSNKAEAIVDQCMKKGIERLLVLFDEMFTHDEIMLLISFYKEIKMLVGFYNADAMKKFLKNSRKLFDPLYEEYTKAIQGLMVTNSLKNQILS